MDEADYERLTRDASSCGMDISTYVRERISKNLTRVFYDPSMTAEVRACREVIRDIAKDVEMIRQRADRDNCIQMVEIDKVRGLVRSVYQKMNEVEHGIGLYRKEIENGNHKVVEGEIRENG